MRAYVKRDLTMYIAEPGDGAFRRNAPVSPVRRQNEQPPLKWTLVLSCIWLMNYWCEATAASGRGLVGCDPASRNHLVSASHT